MSSQVMCTLKAILTFKGELKVVVVVVVVDAELMSLKLELECILFGFEGRVWNLLFLLLNCEPCVRESVV